MTRDTMNILDVLTVGSIVRDGTSISEAHSTSTLIRAGGLNIVVDTSSKERQASIKTSFRQLGILPKDVNIVVLTHAHHDHCGNNDLFKKAKFYVRKEEGFNGDYVIQVSEDMEIAPGVRLMYTPGHTEGSMSVFVESDRKYVITGDAIPLEDNYKRMIPPGINCDPERAMQSIKSIVSCADVMVPGHGSPFLRQGGKIK